MVYRCAYCGNKVASSYKEVKALIHMGACTCGVCGNPLITRKDYIRD